MTETRAWAVLVHFQRAYNVFVTGKGGKDLLVEGVQHILIPFETEAQARIGMSDLITTLVPLLGGFVQGEVLDADAIDQQFGDDHVAAVPSKVVLDVLPWREAIGRAGDRGEPPGDEGARSA